MNIFISQKGFGALAALKRKRKKFSKSRNTSPVLEPSAPSKTESSPNKKVIQRKSFSDALFFAMTKLLAVFRFSFILVNCFWIGQILKRASSVPSRVEDEKKHGDGEHSKSPESSQHEGLTPSTTDESVKFSAALLDPLLRQTHSLTESSSHEPIPHLPNITPVRGHINYQGWL